MKELENTKEGREAGVKRCQKELSTLLQTECFPMEKLKIFQLLPSSQFRLNFESGGEADAKKNPFIRFGVSTAIITQL